MPEALVNGGSNGKSQIVFFLVRSSAPGYRVRTILALRYILGVNFSAKYSISHLTMRYRPISVLTKGFFDQ